MVRTRLSFAARRVSRIVDIPVLDQWGRSKPTLQLSSDLGLRQARTGWQARWPLLVPDFFVAGFVGSFGRILRADLYWISDIQPAGAGTCCVACLHPFLHMPAWTGGEAALLRPSPRPGVTSPPPPSLTIYISVRTAKAPVAGEGERRGERMCVVCAQYRVQ